MKNKILFIIIALITVYSCKNERKNKEINGPVKVETSEDKNFYVLLNVKVKKNDVFEVYYYEQGSTSFSPKDFVSKKVIGHSNFQELKINLPDGMYPERLRLDMGKNKNQELMILKSVALVWEDKKYEFTQNEISEEFKPSKFIDFDNKSLTIKTKVINNRYDPYFYTKKLTNIVDYLLED